MPVHLTCPGCGSAFSVTPFHAKLRRYCSNECREAGRPTHPPIVNDDGSVGIPIHRRDGTVRAYAIVDAADAEWVNQWRWSLSSGGYASRHSDVDGRRIQVVLHRELLGLPRKTDGREGDHRDRVKLNCRRSNLRILPVKGRPNRQNLSNQRGSSSQYRGVCWDKRRGTWTARIDIGGTRRFLGRFTTEHDAGEAARAARLELMPYAVD
jgi:hypothetical protein